MAVKLGNATSHIYFVYLKYIKKSITDFHCVFKMFYPYICTNLSILDINHIYFFAKV